MISDVTRWVVDVLGRWLITTGELLIAAGRHVRAGAKRGRE